MIGISTTRKIYLRIRSEELPKFFNEIEEEAKEVKSKANINSSNSFPKDNLFNSVGFSKGNLRINYQTNTSKDRNRLKSQNSVFPEQVSKENIKKNYKSGFLKEVTLIEKEVYEKKIKKK